MDEDELKDLLPNTYKVLDELKSIGDLSAKSKANLKDEIRQEMRREFEIQKQELLSSHTNLMSQYALMLGELRSEKMIILGHLQNYFDSSEYMDKLRRQVFRFVNQQILTELSEQNVQNIIRSKIEDNLKDGLKPFVGNVVDTVITGMKKRFSDDLQRTKILCQSVESEINHLTQRTGISYSMEDAIRKRIDACLSDSAWRKITNETRLLEEGHSDID